MSDKQQIGGFQLPEVDRLIHEPSRYNIMALLYVVDKAEFLFVKNQTSMTAGNLSSHLTKLESAGYVEVQKEFVGRMPRTLLRLTKGGRKAFDEYRSLMKDVFSQPPGAGNADG